MKNKVSWRIGKMYIISALCWAAALIVFDVLYSGENQTNFKNYMIVGYLVQTGITHAIINRKTPTK